MANSSSYIQLSLQAQQASELNCIQLSAKFALSQLFSMQLEIVSEKELKPDALLGKTASIKIQQNADGVSDPVYLHGLVQQLDAKNSSTNLEPVYHIHVVPWFWFLTQTSDCRIFQDKTSIDIAKQIFGEFGYHDYQIKVDAAKLTKREYCVQYNESAYDFISRLLAEDGIFYFFKHESNKHTLILGNKIDSYEKCNPQEAVYQHTNSRFGGITKTNYQYQYVTGKVSAQDYDFESPATDLSTTQASKVKLASNDKLECFSYPGHYANTQQGSQYIKHKAQIYESQYERITGDSDYIAFLPGYIFTLKNNKDNPSYVLTSVDFVATNSSSGHSQTESQYSYTFEAIVSKSLFVPELLTNKPDIGGLQTAKVVGSSGEEIFTDKYGRIKLQFHWDRRGENNDKSSCWVRVSQAWAGKNWGCVTIPRVGQEVVVAFLEGDPDQPLVIGTLYNGDNLPPYKLPDKASVSGVKTQSTKDADATQYSEISFDDKKGEELVMMQAEKDMKRVIKNDDRLNVTNNSINIVEKGGYLLAADGQKPDHVDQHQVKIQSKTMDVAIENKTVTAKESIATKANKNITLEAANNITLKATTGITLAVGGNKINISNSGITLEGMSITLKGTTSVEIKGVSVAVEGSAMLRNKGGILMLN